MKFLLFGDVNELEARNEHLIIYMDSNQADLFKLHENGLLKNKVL